MAFWDYGNSFLLEASRAGADIFDQNSDKTVANQTSDEGRELQFRYPTYVQDIMGDIFSLGFGPFRWVCTSCDPADLEITDKIALDVLSEMADNSPPEIKQQMLDNINWIKQAGTNKQDNLVCNKNSLPPQQKSIKQTKQQR